MERLGGSVLVMLGLGMAAAVAFRPFSLHEGPVSDARQALARRRIDLITVSYAKVRCATSALHRR